jgi:hypothetical protein
MSNRPNRAHTEAPVMSFEQQVAQVLDSLTKELPMSEPPAGPLDAANEYAAPSTAPDAGPRMNVLRRAFASTSPLAIALDQYRADIEAARPLAETMEGCGDAVSAAEAAFHQRAADAIPFQTVRDALAAVEWVRNDLTESSGDRPSDPDCPAIVRHRDVLLAATADLLREVASTGAGMFAAQETAPTIIPELGITFPEAVERYRALRRDELKFSRKGDEAAAALANQRHCELANQILDAAPSTLRDAMFILRMLANPEMGIASGIDEGLAQRAVERVHATVSAIAGDPNVHPDAELFAAFDRWQATFKADEDDEAAVIQEREGFTAVSRLPARTVAGVLLKLGAFVYFAHWDYSRDKNHPARHLSRTIRKAARDIGGRTGALINYAMTEVRTMARLRWKEQAERQAAVNERDALMTRLRSLEARQVGKNGITPSLDILWPCTQLDDIWQAHGYSIATEEGRTAHERGKLLESLILRTPSKNIADALLQAEIGRHHLMMLEGDLADLEKGPSPDIDIRLLREQVADLQHFLASANVALRSATQLEPAQYLRAFITGGEEARPPADDFDGVDAIFAAAAARQIDALKAPLELTDHMIDAGASAAGITPDQFKAAVKAARESRAA